MVTRQSKPEGETRESKPQAGNDNPDARNEADAAPGLRQQEIGGRNGPDPTRFGDWEKGGRCIDF